MSFRAPFASLALLAGFFQLSSGISPAQALTPLCNPRVTSPIIVDSHEQIIEAGLRAQPPLTNTGGFGFAWPDTPLGHNQNRPAVTSFLASDGGAHPRQMWDGHWVGNNKYGSVDHHCSERSTIRSARAIPQDVSISPNPDPAREPQLSELRLHGRRLRSIKCPRHDRRRQPPR
jgi:hypothetical protein